MRTFGHVIDVLQALPSGAAQCVATSPPYFGLRDYGLSPVVWEPVSFSPMPSLPHLRVPCWADPDAFGACDHEWGEWLDQHDVRETAAHGKTRTSDRFYGESSRRFDGNHQKHAHGQFCAKCGAWRGCLGLEPDPNLYIGHLVQVFRQVRRVLSGDGVLWLNLGDCYSNQESCSLKKKDLMGIPWRAAFALQADGWYLRSDVVWAKGASLSNSWHGNPMPESVTDRPARAHEMVFLFSKRARYFFDGAAVREKSVAVVGSAGSKKHRGHLGQPDHTGLTRPHTMRNLRDVWAVNTHPYPDAHFAVWPEKLVRPMILAGTSEAGHCPACGKRWVRAGSRAKLHKGSEVESHAEDESSNRWVPTCQCGDSAVPDVVLDPFGGSGTTAAVAAALGRQFMLIEANESYGALQDRRLADKRLRGAVESTDVLMSAPVRRGPRRLQPLADPRQACLF